MSRWFKRTIKSLKSGNTSLKNVSIKEKETHSPSVLNFQKGALVISPSSSMILLGSRKCSGVK